VVSIADTGRGMSPRSSAWPSTVLHDALERGRLGLASARPGSRAPLRGEISLSSFQGVGDLTLSFPAISAEASARGLRASLEPLRILAVEDDRKCSTSSARC